MNVFIPKSERKLAANFLKIYEPYVYQGTAESNANEIKKIKTRTCRFCGKNSSQVTFKKDAHLISKLLGSRKFLSAEECDTCNELFGSFENNLANYLGVYRTINVTTKGRKIPSFTSANSNIKIKNQAGIVHIKRANLEKDFKFDASRNEFNIRMYSQPYTPTLVFNAFLKLALSILPKNEVKEYKLALDFLQSIGKYNSFKEIKQIQIAESTIEYEYPLALLYKRKASIKNSDFPLHIFCLYVKNFMFQISFPLHIENLKKIKNSLIVDIAPYAIFGNCSTENIFIKRFHDDLQSSEIKYLDNSLTMKFDAETLNNLVAFDNETKSFIPLILKKSKNK